MANVTKNKVLTAAQIGGVPYGNKTVLHSTFQTNTSGVMTDSDKTAAVANGDVVRIGLLPAGAKLVDALAIISDAFTASTTATIGFAYVDGVDDANVPQDADYFAASLSTAATSRTRATNKTVTPVTLPKDAYLTLTVGGASHASAGRMDVMVDCVLTGTP